MSNLQNQTWLPPDPSDVVTMQRPTEPKIKWLKINQIKKLHLDQHAIVVKITGYNVKDEKVRVFFEPAVNTPDWDTSSVEGSGDYWAAMMQKLGADDLSALRGMHVWIKLKVTRNQVDIAAICPAKQRPVTSNSSQTLSF